MPTGSHRREPGTAAAALHAPIAKRRTRPNCRLAHVAALVMASVGPAYAQILTTDAGVRSPELPSIRTLLSYRHYDAVDELRLRTEGVYSPTRSLELKAVLPVVARRVDTVAGDEDLSGLGDSFLQGKFALVREDGVMRSDRVSLLGRAIFPTGDTDATVNGQPLHPRLQLGLGSYGFGIGAAATVVRDRHRASVAIDWEHRADHGGFDPGDQLGLDVAYWFRLSPARFDVRTPEPEWRAVFELRSLYTFRDHGPGGSVSDRGAQVDGILGLQLNAGTSLRGEIGLVAPLLDDLRDPFGDTGFGVLLGLTCYF